MLAVALACLAVLELSIPDVNDAGRHRRALLRRHSRPRLSTASRETAAHVNHTSGTVVILPGANDAVLEAADMWWGMFRQHMRFC